MIDKKRKLGKKIDELAVGDRYTVVYTIEDKELLLYLGLTDDANPLYLQHDYASQTPYKRPVVPSVLLYGMVSSVVSMHLPGPGSHIVKHEMTFPNPVYHEAEIRLEAEVIQIDKPEYLVSLSVAGYSADGEKVLDGKLQVTPPYELETLNSSSLENFL